MRRSVALISAAVTTFTIVVLVSVVYAYSGFAAGPSTSTANSGASVRTVMVADSQPVQSDAQPAQPALVQPQTISAQAAGAIAAQLLHRTDLYSAEMSSYNGTPAFKISFISGDLVYVSLSGQVLAVVPAPTAPATGPSYGSGDHHSNPGSYGAHEDGGGTEHETEGGG